MPISLLATLLFAMAATSFVSGIFGMAGGMILMGLLLVLFTVPEAMGLHAVAQMSSNAWRGALWIAHVRWRAVTGYMSGCAVAFCAWAMFQLVPSKPVALLLLGTTPFLVRLLPASQKPNPERLLHGVVYGAACMSLMLLTGVAGPLVDSYFLSGSYDRKAVVATKAVCQVLAHGAKLVYFGGLVAQTGTMEPSVALMVVVASMAGTVAAKPVLETLTDTQYRRWAAHIITAVACSFVVQGLCELASAVN